MTTETIKRILDDHDMEYMEYNGYLMVLEHWAETNGSSGVNFIDVTGWTRKQLFDWLGY